MKKFTIYIIGLILTSTVIICPIIYVYKLNVDLSKHKFRRNNYKGQKIIFLGSSHGRDAFKHEIIEDSYNLASSGFSLKESYLEILKLDKQNYFPLTYVISFSPFSLHITNENPEKSNIVFDYNLKFGKNPIINFFKNPSRKEFLKIPYKKTITTQHYLVQLSEKEINLESIDDGVELYLDEELNFGHPYFKKINQYCKENKIRLIYVVTPFSSVYNNLINNNEIWVDDIKKMTSKSKYYEFYDFSNYFGNAKKNSLNFANFSHLNLNGSILPRKTIFISLVPIPLSFIIRLTSCFDKPIFNAFCNVM